MKDIFFYTPRHSIKKIILEDTIYIHRLYCNQIKSMDAQELQML